MNEASEIIKTAVEKGKTQTWKYAFINSESGAISNIQVSGVGLASSGGKENGSSDWFEAIILLDNFQFFFVHIDCDVNNGWYRVVFTLEDIAILNSNAFLLVAKAKETMEWYPL